MADGFSDFKFLVAVVMVEISFDYSGYELRQAQYGSDFVLRPYKEKICIFGLNLVCSIWIRVSFFIYLFVENKG